MNEFQAERFWVLRSWLIRLSLGIHTDVFFMIALGSPIGDHAHQPRSLSRGRRYACMKFKRSAFEDSVSMCCRLCGAFELGLSHMVLIPIPTRDLKSFAILPWIGCVKYVTFGQKGSWCVGFEQAVKERFGAWTVDNVPSLWWKQTSLSLEGSKGPWTSSDHKHTTAYQNIHICL